MKRLTLIALLAATPALAAGDKPFFSLANTDFVVSIGFVVFIGILLYFKIPGMLGGMLDKRAETISNELDEARAIREEAKALLASYERKQKEVEEQSQRIVAHAKEEAETAAKLAKEDLEKSIARRLAAAEDQIASAEASAVKEVRDSAVTVAVSAAADLMAKKMTATDSSALIDAAIDDVKAKLH